MKTFLLCAIAAAAGLWLTSSSGHAEYSISHSVIAGGGATSTGGVFTVSGTIGQPAAGTMTGGNYTLQGGFWSVSVVQTPGAPKLEVIQAGNLVQIVWPSPADGWVLHASPTLTGTPIPWSPVSASLYTTNAARISYTVTSPTGARFFSLQHP